MDEMVAVSIFVSGLKRRRSSRRYRPGTGRWIEEIRRRDRSLRSDGDRGKDAKASRKATFGRLSSMFQPRQIRRQVVHVGVGVAIQQLVMSGQRIVDIQPRTAIERAVFAGRLAQRDEVVDPDEDAGDGCLLHDSDGDFNLLRAAGAQRRERKRCWRLAASGIRVAIPARSPARVTAAAAAGAIEIRRPPGSPVRTGSGPRGLRLLATASTR